MALDAMAAARATGPNGTGDEPDLLGRYLMEIGRTPLLTGEEESDLARRIEAGVYAQHLLEEDDGLTPERAEDLRAVARDGALAKDHMIRANLRLVVSVARRYHQRDMALLDLIQEGNLGLIRAVQKFDYTKGYKFSTYAMWWIRQAIERGVAQKGRPVRLPMHVVEELARFNRVERELTLRLGREPSLAELARESGRSPERAAELKRLTLRSVSLDTPVGEGGDSCLGDLLWDGEEAPAEGAVEFGMQVRQLRALLATLPPREAQILRWRFGLDSGYPCTLQQVGDRLGLTRERVRQLECKALSRLRAPERLAALSP
ncbi:sigma-70 family RNA polymerase sigma factor [Thermopolyspora sp. NPDC052614]|uniref:sigma-70 family RNA polymerase sigma factor n=1 Tax=Thermopolyspora sp. NPDC052614 TaxID=3155682 RepID=UPI00341C4F91